MQPDKQRKRNRWTPELTVEKKRLQYKCECQSFCDSIAATRKTTRFNEDEEMTDEMKRDMTQKVKRHSMLTSIK